MSHFSQHLLYAIINKRSMKEDTFDNFFECLRRGSLNEDGTYSSDSDELLELLE